MKTPLDNDLNKVYESFNQNHDHLRETLMASLSPHWGKRKCNRLINLIQLFIGGATMKIRITKLAAAAVIIIALLIGLNYFDGSLDIAGVAWGEVARKVEEIQMFSYRIKLRISGTLKEKIELEIVMYNSLEHGMRGDSYVNGKIISTNYMPLTGNGIISVFPHEKEYMRTLWSEEQIKKYMESNNPRKVVKKFLEFKYKEIGRDQINGIDVEGIEVNDPKFEPGVYESLVACLWVDVETRLPVRIKLDGVASGGAMQVQTVVDEFQWDIELDAHDFEPNIPTDYTRVAEIEETLDNKDEEIAIQGLRMFAEAADGKYPSSLAFMTVTYEYSKAMRKVLDRRISAIKERIREDQGKQSNLEEQKEIEKVKNEMKKNAKMQLLSIVQSSCMFYGELVKEDKDPAYYGDTVTAEDANAVLIRWKISDDEYRVIFGDLTAEKVTAESLAELEKVQLE